MTDALKEDLKSLSFIKPPSWEQVFMEICEVMSKKSTCCKLKTAAVIVKDGRIISTGYNGAPSGSMHCDEYFRDKSMDEIFREHKKWAVDNELHAERNAIYFAAKSGVCLSGTVMYSLYSPCIDCVKGILSCGIKKVYFKHPYNKGKAGFELLQKNKVEIIKF